MLIAARESFAATARGWRNPYVTSGLIAMWDGIWNAGWGVHDAAATWKDLSGNGYDLTVTAPNAWETNGIRAVGKIVAKTSNMIPSNLTVYGEICVDASRGDGTGAYFWNDTSSGIAGSQKFLCQDVGASVPFICIGYKVQNFSPVLNVNGTFQVNWGNRACCYNGSAISDTTGAYNPASYSGEMLIGGRSKFKGSYGFFCSNALFRSIRIYSRALTAAEIAANYAIDKERFNLP